MVSIAEVMHLVWWRIQHCWVMKNCWGTQGFQLESLGGGWTSENTRHEVSGSGVILRYTQLVEETNMGNHKIIFATAVYDHVV
jgi:hypothetical protein